MTLHEFLASYRDEVLNRCRDKLKELLSTPEDGDLPYDLPVFYDEIVAALRRQAGLPAVSPLPRESQAAAHHGEERQHAGYAVTTLARDFGVISDSIGEVGELVGESFGADEYRLLTQCLDTGIASALDRFWAGARDEQEHLARERIAFLAHELRNSLSNARMAFGVIKSGNVSVDSRTGEVVERNFARMQHLIDQALFADRVHSGSVELKTLALGPLFQNLCCGFSPEWRARIRLKTDPGLEIEADEELLTSALSNLLHNALKFSHAGGVVELRARSEGDKVILEVEDECGGLPVSNPQELFQPHVQRGSDRSGAGLGLAITREAVLALGGEIEVRDIKGKGCVFSITLAKAPVPSSFGHH
ncbi:MAG TPA: HAMP domain-containing sensor histidine kinase [Polyangiaceae bacterium]|nr:HAMP domain-containing sensor histidine kinase [Polyangiaceae bacterium]